MAGRGGLAVGEVINIRIARKALARATHQAKAAENRALHGRTKQQKKAERADKERQTRLLDGAQIDGD
jgi:hypothetical protein